MIQTSVDPLARLLANLFTVAGLALFAGLLAATLGIVHRWYARAPIPGGLSVLVGLTGVVLALNVDSALGTLIAAPASGAGESVFTTASITTNTVTLGIGAVVAAAGGRLGDRIGESVFGDQRIGVDVSGVVEAVGRVITVSLPKDIEDIEGYDVVSPATKESLAGASLVFPRRLTVEELQQRVVARLRSDYGVGHVDVNIDADGTVTYLAVGSRESGLGPTLPPETCAVAVQADPANAASAGDLVRVYRDGESVAAAEVRATAGDTVTLAVDAADVAALNPTDRYRLATLPVEPRSDREFASLLRAADETMGVITLSASSPLVGSPVGAIDASVVAVRTGDNIEPLPPRDRLLAPADDLYVIATPSRLRRLDIAAAPQAADSD